MSSTINSPFSEAFSDIDSGDQKAILSLLALFTFQMVLLIFGDRDEDSKSKIYFSFFFYFFTYVVYGLISIYFIIYDKKKWIEILVSIFVSIGFFSNLIVFQKLRSKFKRIQHPHVYTYYSL